MERSRKRLNLALQGGGAHGAFTWGVLDRIFEDGRIDICGISGTSAGAMNAVAAADGLVRGGRDGAREALELFWRTMSDQARMSPVRRSPLDVLMGTWSLDRSPSYRMFDALTRTFSPYELNPLNYNPLRQVLEACVDFERVRACDEMKLFISATNVETGKVRVFHRSRLTADMVMASACLPSLFQAVEIDGVPYWDGGYVGNPSLFPFHNQTDCADIVIVQINPIERKGAPRTAMEIMNRVNEISFNSSLLLELRSIEFVRRLIEAGKLSAADYRHVRTHLIENQEALKPLGASSKLNAEWLFLTYLRDVGRETAGRWIEENLEDIGERSTVDLRTLFQGVPAVSEAQKR